MKPYQYLCALILIVSACRKSGPSILPPEDGDDETINTTDTTNFVDSASHPVPTNTNYYNCPNGPDYGNTVIFPKRRLLGTDYSVKPINNINVPGTYFAWPAGLVIDTTTGKINVSKSETGVRYAVGFVKRGTKDTCMKELIIGGATYIDSIYVLANNDTLARPHFNANPLIQILCDESGDDDYPDVLGTLLGHGNNKCEFDDDDDIDLNLLDIEPPTGLLTANKKKIRVRTISGVINLKKTVRDGAFGTNPPNGTSREVVIYYRLNDISLKALQNIKVNLIFYNKKSDIPPAVVNAITTKRNEFLQGRLVSPNTKPRPPQIIITRFAD